MNNSPRSSEICLSLISQAVAIVFRRAAAARRALSFILLSSRCVEF